MDTNLNIPEERMEKYLEALKNFRMIDDTFMSKVFENNIPCTETVLRTILEKDDLIVQRVQSQYTIQNLQGRSVRLDIHATDRNGAEYDIEIQRDSGHAGQKRARHNLSMMDANALMPGDNVEKLPETYVIFITEKDVLGMGKQVYKIERTINKLPVLFGDGSHILYINGSLRDESPIGQLMQDFFCKDPEDMHNKVLAERVNYLKNNREGVEKMCEIMENLMKELNEDFCNEAKAEGVKEGMEKGIKKGVKEGVNQTALSMIRKNFNVELISEITGLSVKEIKDLSDIA